MRRRPIWGTCLVQDRSPDAPLWLVTSLVALSLIASCAPSATGPGELSAPGRTSSVETSATVNRPLHVALPDEPPALAGKFAGGAGIEDYSRLFAAPLVRFDFQGNPSPVLVMEVPSLSEGTWT